MNFNKALKAVQEATDGTIAVISNDVGKTDCVVYAITCGNREEVGQSTIFLNGDFTLYRPIPQRTVESVVGKTFPYHEAIEIKRQLGDEVVCDVDSYVNLPSPSGVGFYAEILTYTFSRRVITEFTATVHSGSCGGANQLRVDLPPGAAPGNWVVTARRNAP